MSGGWDHTWVYSGGLSRTFTVVPNRVALRIDGEATFPPLALQLRGYRGQAGSTLTLRTPWWVGADVSAAATVTGSRDALGDRTTLGTYVAARPGVYTCWGSVGLEASFREGVASWFTPSAEVRALFADRYPQGTPDDAVGAPGPAWSFFTAHILRGGGFASVFVLGHVGLWLNGGLEVLPQQQGAVFHAMLGQLGFYSLLGVELAW